MPDTGVKKKLKFDYSIDLISPAKEYKNEYKSDFTSKAIAKIGQFKSILKPVKIKVDIELDESWDEEKIIKESYMMIKGITQVISQRIEDGQGPKEIEKEYKKLSGLQKEVDKWLKKEASGEPDNDKALKNGSKALEAMNEIDPASVSNGPRTAALEALEEFLDSRDKGDDAKKALADKLKAAHEDFKKHGDNANSAIKALLAAGKKIKTTKSNAQLKQFGSDITKDKNIFKSMGDEMDALSAALEEATKLASDGKMDEKKAETYAKLFRKLKSLDDAVDDGFELLANYGKKFGKLQKDLG
jgi:hypothetical protein